MDAATFHYAGKAEPRRLHFFSTAQTYHKSAMLQSITPAKQKNTLKGAFVSVFTVDGYSSANATEPLPIEDCPSLDGEQRVSCKLSTPAKQKNTLKGAFVWQG